jgi:hypothetical protein
MECHKAEYRLPSGTVPDLMKVPVSWISSSQSYRTYNPVGINCRDANMRLLVLLEACFLMDHMILSLEVCLWRFL